MKKRTITALLALSILTPGFCSSPRTKIVVDQFPMKWWYDVPATKYWEGLPIGTGRFGVMIPGSVYNGQSLYGNLPGDLSRE